MEQQIALARLVECGAEARHEVVGQVLDESDRVGHEHARSALRLERAHGGAERREQLVLHAHLTAREYAHPRRLARIRVADQRDSIRLGASHAARAGLALNRGQLGAQLGDPVAHFAPVELGSALARAAPADPAALPIASAAGLAQARRDVGEPRDLHLEPRFAAARVALEDREDHRGAVEHLRACRALEVARLGRRELVVDEHERGARGVGPAVFGLLLQRIFRVLFVPLLPDPRAHRHDARPARPIGELLQLATAHHRAGLEPRAPLRHAPDHLEPERLRKPRELVERRRELAVGDPRELHSEQHRERARRSRSRHDAPRMPGASWPLATT